MLKKLSKKAKLIYLFGILIISFCVVILGSYFYQQHKEKVQIQIKQETNQLQKMKKQYNDFRFADKKDKQLYKRLIKKYEAGIKDKNFSILPTYLTKLEPLNKKLIKENTFYYKKQTEKLEKNDLSNAYDNELERIKEIKAEITYCLKKHTFRSIDDLLKEWKEIIKNMSLIADNLSISFKQIDASTYPYIDLYLSFHDINTNEVPKDLNKKYIYLTEQNGSSKPQKAFVSSLKQQKEDGFFNINMVTSLKTQKNNKAVSSIQRAIKHLLTTMDSNTNNQIELINSNKGIRILEPFTFDKRKIEKKLKKIKTSENIGLYDALYTAIVHTKLTTGAKCIIAFTDGEDNASNVDYPEVIELAKHYQIPIYLIGIGDQISTYTLERIASRTGGFYRNIDNETLIEDIITMIYKEQTELYQLTYRSMDKTLSFDNHNLLVAYQNRLLGGFGESTYIPAIPINNSDYPLLFGIDTVIRNQLLKQLKGNKQGSLLSFEIKQLKDQPDKDIEAVIQYTLQKNNKNKTTSMIIKEATFLLEKKDQAYYFKKQLKKPKTIIKI